jgi:hypothetical protein
MSPGSHKWAPAKIDNEYIQKLGISNRVEDLRQVCTRSVHSDDV